jgi:hypothetical protein
VGCHTAVVYREGPERVRVRCDEHGLTYDPASQEGCTLCRREKKSRGRPVLFAILAILTLATAGLRLALYFKNKPPPVPTNVAVGRSCRGGPNACVAGADCLSQSSGVLPSESGECVKRCTADAECVAPKQCRSLPGVGGSHCVSVVPLGGRCSAMDACEGGDCVSIVGSGSLCLKACSYANPDCPPATRCVPSYPHYCVPVP